jgi:hypothetical protein
MFSGHVYGSHEAPVEKAVNESGKNSRFDKIFMVIFFGDGSESLINDVKFSVFCGILIKKTFLNKDEVILSCTLEVYLQHLRQYEE